MSERKPWFKASPELVDGCSWVPVDKRILLEMIEQWCDEFGSSEGEHFTVEVMMMSDEEIAALPEV